MRSEKRKKYEQEYLKRNRKRIDEYKRKWCIKNRGKIYEYNKKDYAINIEKRKKDGRIRYQKIKEKVLDRHRLRKYGITGEEFGKIIKKQQGICPICKYKLNKNPTVDHDHLTGKIRGFICNDCNLTLGNAKDSPKILRALARYLEETSA